VVGSEIITEQTGRLSVPRFVASIVFAGFLCGCGGTIWRPPPLFPVGGDSLRLGMIGAELRDGRRLELSAADLARDSLIGWEGSDAAPHRVALGRDQITRLRVAREPSTGSMPSDVGKQALIGVAIGLGIVIVVILGHINLNL
jgi:hypothetical protein